jgi:hypothetical protein
MPHASESFQYAAEFPGAPAYILSLKNRLQKPGGEYEVGARLLDFMILTTKDPKVKEELENKRANLAVSKYVVDLNLRFQEFLKSQNRYSTSTSTDLPKLTQAWKQFLKKTGVSEHDLWGGEIVLSSNGRLKTTTQHDSVFGLD